jgi:hypothetical protein
METKQDRLDNIVNKLKDLKRQGIVDQEIIGKFGKLGVRNPETAEQTKKIIELAQSILEASTIEEVLEKRNASGLFTRNGPVVVDKIKKQGLSCIKEGAEATIKQMNDQELFFSVFSLGLEGELTREDLDIIINKAIGEENGNN